MCIIIQQLIDFVYGNSFKTKNKINGLKYQITKVKLHWL